MIFDEFVDELQGREIEKKLDFPVTDYKKGRIEKNMHMHDVLSDYIKSLLEKNGIISTPIGIDARIKRQYDVIMDNNVPDYGFEVDDVIILWDPKAKSDVKNFGMVNLREIRNFKSIIRDYPEINIKIYFIFGLYSNGIITELGHCNVSGRYGVPFYQVRDMNRTFVYDWKAGLPPEFK